MHQGSTSIKTRMLYFNSVMAILVVVIAVAVCLFQFRQDLLAQASDSQEKRMKVLMNFLKQKGNEFRIVDNKLLVGDYVVNDNAEGPDKLKELLGVAGLQSMVQQIASATEQISITSEVVSSDIQAIASVSQELSSASGQVTQTSGALAGLGRKLQEAVKQFHV